MPIPRRTSAEFLAQIKLNPRSRFILFEGFLDKGVFDANFEAQPDAYSYAIEEFEHEQFDVDIAARHFGAKGRLVDFLARLRDAGISNARGVVDRDHDFFIERRERKKNLKYHEYTELEWYAFPPESLRRFLSSLTRRGLEQPLFDSIIETSKIVSISQIARSITDLSAQLPNVDGFIDRNGVFDQARYDAVVAQILGLTVLQYNDLSISIRNQMPNDFRKAIKFKTLKECALAVLKKTGKSRANLNDNWFDQAVRSALYLANFQDFLFWRQFSRW